MKQQSVKKNLKSALSSGKLELNYSRKSSDCSSSGGFKVRRTDSLNENHNMDNLVTGIRIFSNLEHNAHLHKRLKLQGSSLSSKEDAPSVHNIKQVVSNGKYKPTKIFFWTLRILEIIPETIPKKVSSQVLSVPFKKTSI